MRSLSIIILVLFLKQPAYAQRIKNRDSVLLFSYFINNGEDGLHFAYSDDAHKWTVLKNGKSFLKPLTGKDKLMRDPCIVKGGDGIYHMVWTVSWNEKGIGYASSKDLVHWSSQQYLPVMEFEKEALNCWAPEIYYDAPSRTYMIYWATSIPGRFAAGDTAGDGKYNHRIYFVTTNDFKSFSRAAVLYDQGFNVIDATIAKEGSSYLMFLKNETLKPVAEKNIRIARSKFLSHDYSLPSMPITGNYWAEGPTAIKWKGEWIVYFDKYTQHTYGAVSSHDLATWKDISADVSFPESARHGTVLKISAKELEDLRNAFK